MNVPGGLFGMLIALVFCGPLAYLAMLIGTGSQLGAAAASLVSGAAMLLISFLTVYVYAVTSAYLHVLIMYGVALAVPTGFGRWLIYWLLALAYLAATAVYVVVAPPVALAVYGNLTSLIGTAGPAYAFAGMVIVLGAPLQLMLVAFAYGLATRYAPSNNSFDDNELLWRGILAGFNAAGNLVLGTLVAAALFAPLFPAPLIPGLAWGLFCGLVSLAASWMPTSGNTINLLIRVVLGWSSWVLPMSWLVVAIGWILFCLNLLVHLLLGLPFHPWAGYFTINEARIYGECGTMNVEGGVCANLWPAMDTVSIRGGYDLGPFVFIHGATRWSRLFPGGPNVAITLPAGSAINFPTQQHEAGHNLNLAAFGVWYHLVGAIDEAIRGVGNDGRNAHSERLAESNAQGSTLSQLPCWRP